MLALHHAFAIGLRTQHVIDEFPAVAVAHHFIVLVAGIAPELLHSIQVSALVKVLLAFRADDERWSRRQIIFSFAKKDRYFFSKSLDPSTRDNTQRACGARRVLARAASER